MNDREGGIDGRLKNSDKPLIFTRGRCQIWPPMSFWELVPIAPYEKQRGDQHYEENVLVTRLVQDRYTKSPVGTIAHIQEGSTDNGDDGEIQGPALIAKDLESTKILDICTKWDSAIYNELATLLYKKYWKSLPFSQRLGIILGHITIPVVVSLIVSLVVSLISFWSQT